MWQRQKKMARHLLANYQPGEARRERRRRTDQHTPRQRDGKMERAREMECNLSANIARGETEGKDGE